MPTDMTATCTGAKVATVVNAIVALRSKLGGGNESPLVKPSGAAGIVRPQPGAGYLLISSCCLPLDLTA